MAAAIITIPIRWCAAATASSRWISTCPAARRPRRRCSTAFCSCRRRSIARAFSPVRTAMTEKLKDLGDHVAAAFPQDVTGSSIAHGELMVAVRREAIARVLGFLRDDPRCLFQVLVDVCGVDY